MPPSDAERLATIEQVLRDMGGDFQELRDLRREDHHRLRDVESAVSLLTDASAQSRRSTDERQRRLELRTEVLAVVVGFAALVEPFLYALVHH